jgi:hypothetical protein
VTGFKLTHFWGKRPPLTVTPIDLEYRTCLHPTAMLQSEVVRGPFAPAATAPAGA